MRIVFNGISYEIPSVGVALPLWASFQWDLPVPLALTFVSLAWAYCLVLVVLTVTSASRDKKTEDVSLGRGIVESIDSGSRDSTEIVLFVGNVIQRFTAQKGTVGQRARGHSVIFAYMRRSKEIIRMGTIDASTPGRITLRRAQQRAESLSRFARRMLNREVLHNQALFATLIPGAGGALSTGILWMEVWGWTGWGGWFHGSSRYLAHSIVCRFGCSE